MKEDYQEQNHRRKNQAEKEKTKMQQRDARVIKGVASKDENFRKEEKILVIKKFYHRMIN